jgi:signal peptidase II
MMLAGTALVSATAAAVLADQSAKAMMGRRRRVGGAPVARGSPGFTWVRNPRGSVIGLSLAWTVVVWIGAAAGAAVVVTLTPSMGIAGAVGLGLALGGAASNLGDRLARGAVVDVIALWSWPPFNLADAAMVNAELPVLVVPGGRISDDDTEDSKLDGHG